MKVEVAGPGAHDGMRLDLPERVVAFVVVTEQYGRLHASCTCRRGTTVNASALADVIIGAALNIPEEN